MGLGDKGKRVSQNPKIRELPRDLSQRLGTVWTWQRVPVGKNQDTVSPIKVVDIDTLMNPVLWVDDPF